MAKDGDLLEEGLLSKGTGGRGGTERETAGEDGSSSSLEEKLRQSLADLVEHRASTASTRRRRRWRLEKLEGEGEGEGEGRAEWRKKVGEALESTTAHIIILSLLLIDLLATVIDILHTIQTDSRDLSACLSLLDSCTCASFSSSSSSDTTTTTTSDPWEALSYLGIVILCILFLNILGLLVALGPRIFFSHPGYVLDFVVVVTALSLEVFLDSDSSIGLLVIFNLWRIVRVAHGIFEFTDEAWEKNVKKLEAQINSVEVRRQTDLRTINELRGRIRYLEEQKNQGSYQGDDQYS